ncbi:DUF2628 domain-containing protein [Clostridium sp.]|uniref:DUF2628 domain-containing protein n=1 Tax=Clostridium sp. TaxID=1506 RepID=UPI00261DDC12|nr:DUF2628 domain-containing protein [uncultured Clostridium sp.]
MSEQKCPACGASIDLNATECKYCGEAITAKAPQYKVPQQQSINNNAQNSYSQNNYIKPYYQQEFQKISDSNEVYKGKWNWCSFLFTWIWAFTKGLWGLALVTLGINILLSSVKLTWLALVISVLWGLKGNYWYYNLEKNKKQFPNKF